MRAPVSAKLVDKLMQRSVENERAFVENPDRARYVVRRDAVLCVIAFASIICMNALSQGSTLQSVASSLAAAFVGAGLFVGLRKAHAYRSGWLAGRMTMIEAMVEAERSGETIDDWLRGEWARDLMVLGIAPKHRQSDEDDASRDHDDGTQ